MTLTAVGQSSIASNADAIAQASWIWCSAAPEAHNQYACFRKTFEVTASVKQAVIQLAADTRYRLYINGRQVGLGQARYHAAEPSYVTLDLTPHLHPGRNVVAVLVHGMGAVKRCSSFYAVRCGLVAAITLTFNDQTPAQNFTTDATWKAFHETAYAADTPRQSSHQSFIECFDARAALLDWASVDLDDSSWSCATLLGRTHELPPWVKLVPHDLPALTYEPRLPVRASDFGRFIPQANHDPSNIKELAPMLASARFVGDDALVKRARVSSQFPLELACDDAPDAAYVVLDFGQVAAGYITLDIQGRPGTVVDLGYSEAIPAGRHETFKQGCLYCDRFILGKTRMEHGPVLPKTFRYLLVTVRGQATIHGATHHVSNYPFIWRGRCHSSDAVLDAAWQISTHTVQISAEDTFIDTPRRERAGWLADMRPQALACYYAFGDYALARHSIELFFKSQDMPGRFLPMGTDHPGWLLSRYPSIDPHRMPDYNIAMIAILHEYTMHSGDVSLIQQLWPQVQKLVAHNNSYRRADGLYEFTPFKHNDGTYNLTDWAPTDNLGAASPLTMHYADHLRLAAKLGRMMGEHTWAQALDEQHAQTCTAIRQLLWDDARGLFVNGLVNGRLNTRAGYHENLLALLYDIADVKQTQAIGENVLGGDEALPLWNPQPPYELYDFRRDGLLPPWDDRELVPIGSPYFSFYAAWALLESGHALKALNTIRSQWGGILSQGATTVWEEWDGSKGRSHGWGAAPTWLMLRYLLGIEPTQPGFAHINILPTTGDLTSMVGRLPTPWGHVDADWSIENGTITLNVTIPQGIKATLGLPAEYVTRGDGLTHNSAHVRGQRVTLRRGSYVTLNVDAGHHTLTA